MCIDPMYYYNYMSEIFTYLALYIKDYTSVEEYRQIINLYKTVISLDTF